MRATGLSLFSTLFLACGGSAPQPAAPPPPPAAAAVAARSPAVTWDILEREPVATHAEVFHILIGWRDLPSAATEPRAAGRTKAEAEAVVQDLLAKARGGTSFEELMSAHSEDLGSASGVSFKVSPSAQLVIEFKQLSLRLYLNEIGVCQSDFGFHIIKRIR
jgi:hypothetical protein